MGLTLEIVPTRAEIEFEAAFAERVGDQLVQRFQAAWPDPPEAVAMLVDILKGSQLGPGDGWFKKAVAQTRYDWNTTRQRLDHEARVVTPDRRGGGRKIIRSPSNRTSRTCSLPIRAGSDAASTVVTSCAPSNV